MPEFIDTNVFVRHLAADHPSQSPRATRYLMDLEQGLREGWTTILVVSEVTHVMTSRTLYNAPRAELAKHLLPLLLMPALRVDAKPVLRRAFDLYLTTSIDWVDAYHAALIESRGETELVSFDRDFDRVPGLRRREP